MGACEDRNAWFVHIGFRVMSVSIFANNLRKYRKNKVLTQVALGDLAGYAQGHISNLERGVLAPSMAVLERLATVLGISPAELLMTETKKESARGPTQGLPVVNERTRDRLVKPRFRSGRVVGDSGKLLCLPDLGSGQGFAAFLPDNSMAPVFGKGDLVIFSLNRKPKDGDACLVGKGKGQVLFRTVWALPGGGWGLKANNPKYEPMVVKGKRVRIWPAVGHRK